MGNKRDLTIYLFNAVNVFFFFFLALTPCGSGVSSSIIGIERDIGVEANCKMAPSTLAADTQLRRIVRKARAVGEALKSTATHATDHQKLESTEHHTSSQSRNGPADDKPVVPRAESHRVIGGATSRAESQAAAAAAATAAPEAAPKPEEGGGEKAKEVFMEGVGFMAEKSGLAPWMVIAIIIGERFPLT